MHITRDRDEFVPIKNAVNRVRELGSRVTINGIFIGEDGPADVCDIK